MYEDENGTNKPKIYVPLAAILLALALFEFQNRAKVSFLQIETKFHVFIQPNLS